MINIQELSRTARLAICYTLIIITSGCGGIAMNMAATAIPSSKYMPSWTSEKAVDDYFALITTDTDKVVSDELGTYFHHAKPGGSDSVFLSKEDEGALRNLVAGDVGLLEPLYTYNKDGIPVPDWAATQRRHDFLVKEVRLRVLPITATKKYHELIESFAITEAKRLSGAMSITTAAFGGNYGLYNDQYSTGMLDKVGGDFQYLIKDPVAGAYYARLSMQAMGAGDPGLSAATFRSARLNLGLSTSVQFVPRSYFSALKKGGAFRINSGCYATNLQAAKDLIRWNKEMMDVPYLSAISSVNKDKSPSEISEQKQLLVNQLIVQDRVRSEAERACKAGLQALQVSGSIQSQKLK